MKTIESHQIQRRAGTHPLPPAPMRGDAPPGHEGCNLHPPMAGPPPGKATDDDREGGGSRSGQGVACEEEGKPGSSRGEEEAEDEESEEDAPEVGADGQPQPDRASSNKPRSKAPTATGDGQVGVDQPPVPPTDATDSVIQPSATPTGIADSSA